MKCFLRFLICILVLLNFFTVTVGAETILDIIPDESKVEFENEEILEAPSNELREKTSFESILNLIISGAKEYLPDFCRLMLSLLMFVMFFSMMDQLSFTKISGSNRLVISCLASAVMALFLIAYFSNACTIIEKNLETICVFCDASIPIITVLLIQGGKSFASTLFSYSISLSSTLINSMSDSIFMPLIRIYFAVGCCAGIWTDVDFSAVTDMIQKFIKWLIGIVFSIFTFAITIQNVLVKSADNTAQKILKNAAAGIPYMGSVLVKGLDGAFMIASGTKNTSCIVGIAVILSVFAGPAIMLCMQSVALYIAMTASKLFGQNDCLTILKTVHKAYLLMLSLFLVSVLMCIICFLMICLGVN